MTYSKRLKTLLGLSILGSTALSQATLVAHYKFDEGSGTTATDSAGGDQNAATNQGTIGWTPTGKIGGALDLPGNASLQVADAIGAGATAFTLSVWVNMDDNPGYDGIFSARDTENWGLNVNGGSAANLAFDYRFDRGKCRSGLTQWFGDCRDLAPYCHDLGHRWNHRHRSRLSRRSPGCDCTRRH